MISYNHIPNERDYIIVYNQLTRVKFSLGMRMRMRMLLARNIDNIFVNKF